MREGDGAAKLDHEEAEYKRSEGVCGEGEQYSVDVVQEDDDGVGVDQDEDEPRAIRSVPLQYY